MAKFKKFLIPVIILIFSLWQLGSLLDKRWPTSHDGIFHVIRIREFFYELKNDQFPVRWTGRLDNGYGIPLFSYVYPGPYLLSSIPMVFGINDTVSYKIVMFFAYLTGIIGFYCVFYKTNRLLAIIGSLIFARSSSLPMAAFSRFISGIMMSFGLIACLKLASLWLPPARLALASSLIVTIGMFGAAAAQTSVTFLVGAFDWRYATMFIAGAGGLITVIIGFFVKQSAPSAVSAPSQGVFQSLREAAKEPQNWLCGTFIATINLPVAILGALFGVTYLTSTYGVSAMQGATIVAMLFTGMICGSPFFGFISDRFKKRKMLVLSGGAACLVLMLMVMYLPELGSVALHLLFFGVGFTSACQVLGYPMIAEANPPANTGTALSLAAILIMGGGYGLGLPFVGYLLDMNWGSAAAAYQHAFLSIPIGIAIGLVAAIFAKDP